MLIFLGDRILLLLVRQWLHVASVSNALPCQRRVLVVGGSFQIFAPWPFWLKIANAQIVKCSQVLWVVRTSFFRRFHQRQWWSTSHQLLPCTRRLHPWMRTSRLLLACPWRPAPVDKYVAPAPAMHAAPSPVDEYVAPAPAVMAAPVSVDKYIAPRSSRVRCTCTSGVHRARSSSVRCTCTSGVHRARPAVYVAPAPVEYIAPRSQPSTRLQRLP